MTENADIPDHMSSLPTELLSSIFMLYLPAKDLIRCRQVCCRWKLIIEELAWKHQVWMRYCETDFPSHYRTARLKSKNNLSWFDFYKSLSIWGRLSEASEERDEFASASGVMDEIRMFQITFAGEVGVLNKSSLKFYDISTLEVSDRNPVYGSYSRYIECERALVIQNSVLHLYIVVNTLSYRKRQTDVTFYDVKLFTASNSKVFFVNLNDDIFVCDLIKDDGTLSAELIKHSDDGVVALGCENDQLNILLFNKNIYTVINNEMVYKTTLGPECNLFNQLQKYNLLDQMDWRIYVQWMYMFQRKIPEGPFRELIIVRQYGDVFFVGSNWGVLRIYYAPLLDEKLNLFDLEPVKQYNFMERPILSPCPIIGIDVLEIENGHKVLVAMPKKIVVLTFTHNFVQTASLAERPYDEEQYDDDMDYEKMLLECNASQF